MAERSDAWATLLAGKASLEDCSTAEIQQLAIQYPYFAPVQILYWQKLEAIGAPEADRQRQKVLLYTPDPLRLDYLLQPETFYPTDFFAEPETSREGASSTLLPQAEAPSALLPEGVAEAEKESGHDLLPTAREPEEKTDRTAEDREPPTHFFTEHIALSDAESAALQPAEPAGEALPAFEIEETAPKNAGEPKKPASPDHKAMPVAEEPSAGQNTSASDGIAETKPGLPAGGRVLVKPTEGAALNQEAPLSFEPYHTVDYFASQGIKMVPDEMPKDKLTRQLRSFTEWLKVMKRLPAPESDPAPQSTAEKSVESLASHSVAGSDVVTEAMAEVWCKQGNRQKAIETYNKLSLQNPSKKAYFAAKIENLKAS